MILNKQRKVRLATRPLHEFLRKTQRELKIANSEITIAFVTDAEIARWNESYRNKKGPTDVLSFPAVAGVSHKPAARKNSASSGVSRSRATSTDGSKTPELLGDIAIAPETARRYARKNGRSLQTEIRVLMLHGVLHLMGYDHESDTGQMNRIEQKLRRKLKIA